MNVNEMEYKGYIGTIEWSESDQVFHGRVLGISDLLSYEGNNIKELKADFYDIVDEYIEECKQEKRKPEIPFKGSFNVRVGSDLHREAYFKAKEEKISLNKLMINALTMYLNQ